MIGNFLMQLMKTPVFNIATLAVYIQLKVFSTTFLFLLQPFFAFNALRQ